MTWAKGRAVGRVSNTAHGARHRRQPHRSATAKEFAAQGHRAASPIAARSRSIARIVRARDVAQQIDDALHQIDNDSVRSGQVSTGIRAGSCG